MKKFISVLMALCMLFGTVLPLAVSADEITVENFTNLPVEVTNRGAANGYMRLVVSNSSFPFTLTDDCLTGATISGTLKYLKPTEYPYTDIVLSNAVIAGNETSTRPDEKTVLKIAFTSSMPATSLDVSAAHGTVYSFHDFVMNHAGAVSEVTVENFTNLPVEVTNRGSGSGYLRLVVNNASFPFTLTDDCLTGATISGTLHYLKKEEYGYDDVTLTNAVVAGNETTGRNGTTVLKIAFNDQIPASAFDFTINHGTVYSFTDFVMNHAEGGSGTEPDITPLTDTLFLSSADFPDIGAWELDAESGSPTGKALKSAGATSGSDNASATILIPEAGTYTVYGMARDFATNQPGTRKAQVIVNDTTLPTVLGTHGQEGYRWQKAGTVTITQEKAKVELKALSGFARCGILMLTKNSEVIAMIDGDISKTLSEYYKVNAAQVIGEPEITSLRSYGDTLTYSLANKTREAIVGSVIGAIYDESGRLVEVKQQAINLEAGAKLEKQTMTLDAINTWKTGKLFFWNSLSQGAPLIDTQDFTFSDIDFAVPDEGTASYEGTIAKDNYMLTYKNEHELIARDGIDNTISKLKAGENVTVAYVGGSITQGNTWSRSVTDWLKSNYTSATINEINFGLSGTEVALAACRVGNELLPRNPDLMFIEYTVNDDGSNSATTTTAHQLEGLIRQIWTYDPTIDIVLVCTTQTSKHNNYASGNYDDLPYVVKNFDAVAEHYGIPVVFFGYEVFDLYDRGLLTLKSDSKPTDQTIWFSKDGIHPTGDGGVVYAGAVARSFLAMEPESSTITNHSIPTAMHADNWENATQMSLDYVKFDSNWFELPSTGSTFTGYGYSGGYLATMAGVWNKMMGTKTVGATMTIKFNGTDMAIFELGGKYSNQMKVTIDGVDYTKRLQEFVTYDTKPRHQYYFISSVYGSVLPAGVHTVTLTLDGDYSATKSSMISSNAGDNDFKKIEAYIGSILVVGTPMNANE